MHLLFWLVPFHHCVHIGWQQSDDASAMAHLQHQLDPIESGKITRDRFLSWLKDSYSNAQQEPAKVDPEPEYQQQESSNQQALEKGPVSHRSAGKLDLVSTTMKKPEASVKDPPPVTSKPEVKADATVVSRLQTLAKAGVDWEKEFESVMRRSDRVSNEEEAADETRNIVQGLVAAAFLHRFREAAELVTQTIVQELALSNDIKSLPELQFKECERKLLGGSWGTSMRKFWCNGLVAFVIGSESNSTAQSAKSTNTSNSSLQPVVIHKLLGHQLRASRAIHDAIHRSGSDCESLHVPLQCTVDYLGFRCIVFASNDSKLLLDISNLFQQQPRDFQSQLKCAFNALGLMTDSLQPTDSRNIEETGDLAPAFAPRSVRFEALEPREGGTFQQIRIHSLYDLFPADIPAITSTSHSLAQATELTLFKFRPEFARLYGEMLPLHSNAHRLLPANTNYDLSDSDSDSDHHLHRIHELLEMELLQQAACSASQYLQYQVIPSFMRSLEDEGASSLVDSRSLTRAMHREGINVRYLGICFSLATKKHVKRLLLSEMVARVSKIELRAALRSIVQETSTKVLKQALATDGSGPEPQDVLTEDQADEYQQEADKVDLKAMDPETIRTWSRAIVRTEARQVVVAFFNLVLGISSSEAKVFWKERILPHMRRKFGLEACGQLLTLEAIISDDLLHTPQLFQALQVHSNVAFADVPISFNWKAASPLSLEDLQPHSLIPITKLIARTITQCEDALANSETLLENQQLKDALLQLKVHIAILSTSPSDERALSLSHLLTCAAELSFQLDLLDDTEKFAALAVENGSRNHALSAKAHTISMKIKYHVRDDLEAVRSHFTEAVEVTQWHLGTSHPWLLDTYLTMVEILRDCGEYDEALKVLTSCGTMTRECFGKTSLVYADVRRKQGELLFESRVKLDEAVGVLEDAISIYEKHFQDDDSGDDETSSLGSSCKALAASCCFLIAAIHSELSGSRSTAEKAFSMARRALTLRKEMLIPNHVDILASLLQLGALANELSDHFRALEYFKPALVVLKQLKNGGDEERVGLIRMVTQTVLQLQLQALAEDKLSVVERTRKRFAALTVALVALYRDQAADTESRLDGTSGRTEAQLLAYVMKKLLADDASEYLESLVERTGQELLAYRRQYTMNLTGTIRKESAEAPSPHFKRLQSIGTPSTFGSRFASFSGVGLYPSPPGSPLAVAAASPARLVLPLSPLPPARNEVLGGPGSPDIGNDSLSSPMRTRLSFSQMDCSFLTTPLGEFTFGGQLAALLFLAELPSAAAIEQDS